MLRLIQAQSVLDEIVAFPGDAVFVKDARRYMRYTNDAFDRMFNAEQGACVDRHASEFLPPDVREVSDQTDTEVLATGEPVFTEVTLAREVGGARRVQVVKKPVVRAGEIAGLIGCCRYANEDDALRASVMHECERSAAHRTRNILSTIQYLIEKVEDASEGITEASADLVAQVQTIADVHGLLGLHEEASVRLSDLVQFTVAPVLASRGVALTCDGPPLSVRGDDCVGVALALRQMATESAGVLSSCTGHALLGVSWAMAGDECILFWNEHGRAAGDPPARARSTGAHALLQGQLGAEVEVRETPGMRQVIVRLPRARLRAH